VINNRLDEQNERIDRLFLLHGSLLERLEKVQRTQDEEIVKLTGDNIIVLTLIIYYVIILVLCIVIALTNDFNNLKSNHDEHYDDVIIIHI
jgi:hypothetical protein